MGPLLRYSDKLYDLLDKMQSEISDAVALELIKIESDPIVDNTLNIDLVDVSKQDWSFDITIGGKVEPMKINRFVKHFLKGAFSDKQIFTFAYNFNKIRKGEKLAGGKKYIKPGNKIEVPEFKLNPTDIRSTFISLVTETYPHPNEDGVVKYLPTDLTKDEFGNYYKIVGSSETMFTCHLDTADRQKSKVVLYSEIKDGEEFISSDETTILGADDKAGVSIVMYMIANNIPGVYYFFIGEERGGIGSGNLSYVFDKVPHLNGLKRCVSFDRRNYYSVITEQLSGPCCSDEFGQALCDQLNAHGMEMKLDPTGVYTDSYNFIEYIPECTNISVGYFNEHTVDEVQNITYLGELAKAVVKVDWESLPTVKKAGLDDYILAKYSDFISDVKKSSFDMETKCLTDMMGNSYIRMEMETDDIEIVADDLLLMSSLLTKHNMDPDITFAGSYIKIELN